MPVVFLGDVYLPQPYSSCIEFDEYVFNLEHPITKSNDPINNTVNLKSDREYISETFNSSPSAVCLANNHIMDYGEEGLEDTIELLEEMGVDYFGAGHEEINYNNPAVINIDGKRIALFAYADQNMSGVATELKGPGVSPLDINQFQKDVDKVNKNARIVVQVHWGAEEVHYPRPKDVRLARKLIDSGADLVTGHHSHCIQPWESYKNKKIFYGLGNCIMPDIYSPSYFSEEKPSGKIFSKNQKSWNKRSIGVEYHPENNEYQLVPLQFTDGHLKSGSVRRDRLRALVYQKIYRNVDYKRAYRMSHIYGKARTVGINYVRNPSVITLKDLKDFLRLIQRDK